MGKMKNLRILSLSNNHLRGSMPEGLVSNLGATKVQDYIMPGNRLADVDTVSLSLSLSAVHLHSEDRSFDMCLKKTIKRSC